MRISATSDYALRALIEIAVGASLGDPPFSAEEISQRQDIPPGFLQNILADLRRAGILSVKRGNSGGWRLSRAAADISVADVVRAIDGPLVSVYDQGPEAVEYNDSAKLLQLVWIAVRSSLREVLEPVTLESFVSGTLPDDVTSRTDSDDAWQPR